MNIKNVWKIAKIEISVNPFQGISFLKERVLPYIIKKHHLGKQRNESTIPNTPILDIFLSKNKQTHQ